jgi:hypothetical protein
MSLSYKLSPVWASVMRVTKNYAALASVFNRCSDFDDSNAWNKRMDLAKEILRNAGPPAVDAIIAELEKHHDTHLALILCSIGDPRAVRILRKQLALGRYSGWPADDIRRFVALHPIPQENIEVVCAVCGQRRAPDKARSYMDEDREKWFCAQGCWSKRGTVVKTGVGYDCPRFSQGLCNVDGNVCSLQKGTYADCVVYRMRG